MRRGWSNSARASLGLVASALVVACGPGKGGASATEGTDSTTTSGGTTVGTSPTTGGDDSVEMPRHSEWETVVEGLPFPLTGEAAIRTLMIGRQEFNENFANRGNIEVLFDHPEETITIEIRKYIFGDVVYAFGDPDAGIPGTFERLSLWAFVSDGNPGKPEDQPPASDCAVETWKDGCAIYAYYDGKSQPARSGMDFRVHLPAGYRGKLYVETEDNAWLEASYPRRGNITIDGLCGSAEVELEAGWAEIQLCDELTPSPTCSADEIAACEDYVDPETMAPAPWSKDCGPCGDTLFGRLLVTAPQPWAANITIDIPKHTWISSTVQNNAADKPHLCKPTIAACSEGGPIPCTLDAEDDYTEFAEFNYPGPSAPSGAGYSINARSGGCTEIPFVDDPAQWKPEEEGVPASELRGFVRLCTGCL